MKKWTPKSSTFLTVSGGCLGLLVQRNYSLQAHGKLNLWWKSNLLISFCTPTSQWSIWVLHFSFGDSMKCNGHTLPVILYVVTYLSRSKAKRWFDGTKTIFWLVSIPSISAFTTSSTSKIFPSLKIKGKHICEINSHKTWAAAEHEVGCFTCAQRQVNKGQLLCGIYTQFE